MVKEVSDGQIRALIDQYGSDKGLTNALLYLLRLKEAMEKAIIDLKQHKKWLDSIATTVAKTDGSAT